MKINKGLMGFQAMDEIHKAARSSWPIEKKLHRVTECLIQTEPLGVHRVVIQKFFEHGFYGNLVGEALIGPPHKIGEHNKLVECPPLIKMLNTRSIISYNNPRAQADLDYLIPLMDTIEEEEHVEFKGVLFAPVILGGNIVFALVMDALGEKDEFTTSDIDFVTRVTDAFKAIYKWEEQIAFRSSYQAKSMIINSVAHEIRNPIVSLGGFARRLRDKVVDMDSEAIHTHADIILHHCNRLETILKNVRLFDTNAQAADKQKMPVNQIIELFFADKLKNELIRTNKITLDIHSEINSLVLIDKVLTLSALDTIFKLAFNELLEIFPVTDRTLKITAEENHSLTTILFSYPARSHIHTDQRISKHADLLISQSLAETKKILEIQQSSLVITTDKDEVNIAVSLPKVA